MKVSDSPPVPNALHHTLSRWSLLTSFLLSKGTPVPIQLLRLNDPTLSEEDRKLIPTFDLSLWSQSHPPDHVEGLLRELTAALKTAGKGDRKNILNVAGYCFGGKFALRMAGWDSVSSVASFHPSLRCPTYVGLAEFDNMVPPTLKEDLERWATISGEPDERRRFEPVVSVYPGVDHGFAARPDTNDPVVAAQYAKALDDASNFFLL
ncbi:hypothetical protein N7457_005893 [Penicillium paradoxum]|uniref:uncharacterized protein n=1 Tax=Penicillium paradoxum TaxID=176176 RepID=UPI0025485F3A|nr:uncharacterized protein N7457_005893 [Penicillium paradoxum]KAJ5780733.1 hypothetical protein N7457_005893 [Penicillium paradoxum]